MKTRMNFYERLLTFVDRPDECWDWPGAKCNGYGVAGISVDCKPVRRYTYRLAYELLRGPIPKGLHIDHLCRNRACFNPFHLGAVTQQENIRRGNAGINNRVKTHCKQGHPFDEANTSHRLTPYGTPARCCLACKRDRWHRVERFQHKRNKAA